jgi:hypothetical protein
MMIGTTYSTRHIAYFGLDQDRSLRELAEFGFDVVRVCTYWSEIQQQPEELNLTQLIRVLDTCEAQDIQVVMTLGMKAPGWPEVHLPTWLKDMPAEKTEIHLIRYISLLIKVASRYTCIKHWQVENEPFDPTFPHRVTIPESLIKKEIKAITRLDNRPVLITVWGNKLITNSCYDLALKHADLVGLDIYFDVPVLGSIYTGPQSRDWSIRSLICRTSKPVWITELQASPWETTEKRNRSDNTPSINPEKLIRNYDRATRLGADAILFWGFEYWLWKKHHGDAGLYDTAARIVSTRIPHIQPESFPKAV